MKSRIENALRKALLLNGKMSDKLFEYELKEHIDYWKKGMERDRDECLLVVTENDGDVAILVMTNKDESFTNEKALQKLHQFWGNETYKYNIEFLLPVMIDQLSNDIISVNGLKTAFMMSR
jgi:hypothetical protein